MKKIIKEIAAGTKLQENLPKYGNYLANLYNRSAAVELAMDYYTYYEILEEQTSKDAGLHAYVDKLNAIIQTVLVPGKVDEEREQAIAKIHQIRDDVYKKVDALATYADIFAIYEYVSNRCEYLFKDTDLGNQYSDEEFTRQIMQYIFSDSDNTVINSKISEIVAELPLRMTKNKFFQYLSEGMTVYNQTDKETVDDFVYLLKSSSMLVLPEQMEEFENLFEIYQYAKNMQYDTITKEQFEALEQKLAYAADYIENQTNLYTMLQGIVNKTYVMLICVPYADNSSADVTAALEIIREVGEEFSKGEYHTLSDEIAEGFSKLEGVPEAIHSEIAAVEYPLDDIKLQHLDIVKSIMCEPLYHGLFLSQCLLSDSLFIDLSRVDEIMETQTEEDLDIRAYIKEQSETLETELTELFKANQKIVNRSVMALILSRLPVFFNNITEIQDYVYHSLSGCTNKAEKSAVVEIVKCIMQADEQ